MKYKAPSNLLIRTSLLVAVVAGVATAGLTLTRIKQRLEGLQADLLAQTAGRHKAETDLANSRNELAATADALHSTRNALDAAAAEKRDALSVAAVQTRRAEKLSNDLAEVRQERDDARETLARYKVAGMEPEQVVHVAGRIKQLQASLAAAEEKNRALTVRVHDLVNLVPNVGCVECEVTIPAGLKANVLSVDPKWRFIVLDAGEAQGVLERGELLVSRHGTFVGRARVSRVQGEYCIANLMPGWDVGEVMEGDVAIPAHPGR